MLVIGLYIVIEVRRCRFSVARFPFNEGFSTQVNVNVPHQHLVFVLKLDYVPSIP